MPGRLISVLLVGCAFFAHGAIPNLSVSRTGSLFFAASDLTTNGIPGLTNPVPRFLVSRVSGESTRGGGLSLIRTQAWARRYNGPPGIRDTLQEAVVSPEGFVTVVGTSSHPFGPNYALVTIRYTPNGTALWTNRHDSPVRLYDYGCWVGVDDSLNAYVVGTIEPSPQITDLVILKYAPDGTALWTNRFNQFGTNYHGFHNAVLDPAGNLVLAFSANYPLPDHYSIAKFNPSGGLVWITDYLTSGDPYVALNAFTIDATGAPIATGTDYATIRYSPDGAPLWTNAHSWPESGVPSDLVVDHRGNILVTGDTWRFDPPNQMSLRHYTTIKFTSDGIPLWTNRLDPPGYQGGSMPRVLVDAHDNVILIGGSTNLGNSDVDFTLTKLRADGLLLWTTRHFETNLSGFRLAIDAAVDAAGNTHVIYNTRSGPGAKTDFVVLQFSPDGVPLSTNRFEGGHVQAHLRSIVIDAAGRVLLAGTADGPSGSSDFATVQYVNYVHYTPPRNFVGTDTFTFVATDISGAHATNTVTVTVEVESLWFNPSLSNLRDTGEGRRLHLDGAFGTVVLHASSDLASWAPIATNAAMNGSVEFKIPPAGPHQFYRAAQSAP